MALYVSLSLSSQLGPHLKALRKKRNLSQQELGKLVGVSQTRIAAIEADPGVVSVDQLMRLCRVLGADIVLRTGAGVESGENAFAVGHIKSKPPGNVVVMSAEENAQMGPRLNYIARLLGVPLDNLVGALEKQFPAVTPEALAKVDVATLSPNQVANLAADLDVKEGVLEKVLHTFSKRWHETEGTVLDQPPTKGSW